MIRDDDVALALAEAGAKGHTMKPSAERSDRDAGPKDPPPNLLWWVCEDCGRGLRLQGRDIRGSVLRDDCPTRKEPA